MKTMTEPAGVPASETEFRIAVGDAVIALACASVEQADRLSHYFGLESSRREPQVRLKLTVIPGTSAGNIPDSLFLEKRTVSGRFSIAGSLVRGAYSTATGAGVLRVQSVLVDALIRLFEQLLYQAYYSARARTGEDAFLIHSSGVIRNGAGFLFVGRSGSGKSTAARLSLAGRPGCLVLNDEVCLVRFSGGDVSAHSTPFNGFFSEKRQGSAPLRAVFLLEQADRHHLVETSPVEAALRLYAQIVPPMGLDETLTLAVRGRMLEQAGRLADRVPIRRLGFLPDPEFWYLIDREFPD